MTAYVTTLNLNGFESTGFVSDSMPEALDYVANLSPAFVGWTARIYESDNPMTVSDYYREDGKEFARINVARRAGQEPATISLRRTA